MRILGVDPGLTRCGIGVIDVSSDRTLSVAHVSVIVTKPTLDLPHRLLTIRDQLSEILDEFRPARVALERVFAQANLRSVMGTAQVSGIVLTEAASRELAVDLHTPTEVKASITGSGRAAKPQVANMVARLTGLDTQNLLPDATDALALAICNAWRGGSGLGEGVSGTGAELTPAQRRWREAESLSRATRRSN